MKTLLNILKKAVLPCLALGGAAYAVYYSVWAQEVVPTGPPGVAASDPITPAAGATVLAGPGLVKPNGGQVSVTPPMPGVVEWVISQERVNSPVKKGEDLLRLDSQELRAELEVRKAQLEAARAELNKLKSPTRQEELAPLEAKWRKSKHLEADAKQQYEKDREARAAASGAITEQELQGDLLAWEAAKAQTNVDLAEWRLKKAGAWEQDIKVAEAQVKLAESQVAQTERDLGRLTVKCLADTTLLRVDVRPQEYVGVPSDQTIILLGDTSNLEVEVYIDEHDASRFKEGAKAVAHLLRGEEVAEIPLVYKRFEPVVVPKPILTGEQTERVDVRVLPVIYRFANPEDQKKVFVGQELDVFINE